MGIAIYNQALFNNAAKENDVETLELSVSKGVNINFQERKRNFTALHWAVYNHNFSMVKLLMKQGADVNIIASHPFYNGWELDYPSHVTPIELALDKGNYSIYSLFLSEDIQI